jgi:hypothetical protein
MGETIEPVAAVGLVLGLLLLLRWIVRRYGVAGRRGAASPATAPEWVVLSRRKITDSHVAVAIQCGSSEYRLVTFPGGCSVLEGTAQAGASRAEEKTDGLVRGHRRGRLRGKPIRRGPSRENPGPLEWPRRGQGDFSATQEVHQWGAGKR